MSLQSKVMTSLFRPTLKAIQRRPLSSLTATVSATALLYASNVERNADNIANSATNLDNPDALALMIPRSHYDPDAITTYWEQRPISIMKRIMSIAWELGPIAGEYAFKFHARPWIEGLTKNGMGNMCDSSNNDDDKQMLNGKSDSSVTSGKSDTHRRKAQCDTISSQNEVSSLNSIFHNLDNATEEETGHIANIPFKQQAVEQNLSQKLRCALTSLGPTFIKVGQQLSIRPDLASPIVLQELQKLCDAVPPFDDAVAMRVLAEELLTSSSPLSTNSERKKSMLKEKDIQNIILGVFDGMPQLVASASLGQVYKATLRSDNENDNGPTQSAPTKEQVAIKIQRPDILETVTLDLFLLVTYGKVVDKLLSYITNQVPYHETFLNGFSQGAFMELNYIQEAQNQMYFRGELQSRFSRRTLNWNNQNDDHSPDNDEVNNHDLNSGLLQKNSLGFPRFLQNFFQNRRRADSPKNLERVIVPKVYQQFTTLQVLITEWIDGIPLAQAPSEQIRELIPVGVELFLCQLLEMGRFHADPHPGNLYVTTSKVDGVTPTLCLLDFGLIAYVDEDARRSMTHAILHLLQGDYDTLIAHDAKQLGFLPHDMDVTELQPVLKTILKEGLVESGSNLHDRRRNLMGISKELNEVFFKYPFSVPPFFALVTRGLGLLEGVALSGDPSFDIFKASYPYARRLAMEQFRVADYGKISRNLISLRLDSSNS